MQVNSPTVTRHSLNKPRQQALLFGTPAGFAWTVVSLAIPILLLAGCNPAPSLVGQPQVAPPEVPGDGVGDGPAQPLLPSPQPTGSGANGAPIPSLSEGEQFQRNCEAGVNEWTSGRVSYPVEISVSLNDPKIYNVVVDVEGMSLPPEQMIDLDQGTVASESVAVRCDIAARLSSAGDAVEVTQNSTAGYGGWVIRTFVPPGVAEWAWSIAVQSPVGGELLLELQPAVVQENTVPLPGLADGQVASFTTQVNVNATVVQRVSYWFETEWSAMLVVVGGLGAAAVGLLVWWERYFSRAARSKRRGQSEHVL